MSRVSVIITTYNRKEKVVNAISSVLKLNAFKNQVKEIIIVDDGSTDGTPHYIKDKFPNNFSIKIYSFDEERLISGARNFGASKSSGEYLFFIDDDVVLCEDSLSTLLDFMDAHPRAGCSLPVILYYDKPEIVWCAGIKHNMWTTVGELVNQNEPYNQVKCEPYETDSVLTAFLVRSEVMDQCSFDSSILKIGWEDMDFTSKVRNIEYSNFVVPTSKVYHDYSGANFLRNPLRLYYEVRNRIIFHKRWNNNRFQRMVSIMFSIGVATAYIFLSMKYSDHFWSNIKIIRKGLVSGILTKP